jgi:hypothetical protein
MPNQVHGVYFTPCLDGRIHPVQQFQQLTSAPAGPGCQNEFLQLRSSLLAPQLGFPAPALVHRQRLQLIHDPCAHLHQPVPVPQQLTHITIFRTGYPDARKAIFHHQLQQQLRVLAVGLCFLTRLVLISAGSPIHTSKPNSASRRSNQREYPVASIPTRTHAPCSCRSR